MPPVFSYSPESLWHYTNLQYTLRRDNDLQRSQKKYKISKVTVQRKMKSFTLNPTDNNIQFIFSLLFLYILSLNTELNHE